nr:chromosome segregation protein SMC [Streptomyces sp. DSM 41633]
RTGSVALTTDAPAVADLVSGPASLMAAVRRLVRDTVVVPALEDAEALVAAHPELTAVTGEGDVLSAHFAHGGSAGAPSLLEVQASVDEAAAELAELVVRCEELAQAQRLAGERRKEGAALVEELGERRRAAEREKSGVA